MRYRVISCGFAFVAAVVVQPLQSLQMHCDDFDDLVR